MCCIVGGKNSLFNCSSKVIAVPKYIGFERPVQLPRFNLQEINMIG
jgi:hypothetical protein